MVQRKRMKKDKNKYPSYVYECFDMFYYTSSDEAAIGYYKCSKCINMDIMEINLNRIGNKGMRYHIEKFHPKIHAQFNPGNTSNFEDRPQLYMDAIDFSNIMSKVSQLGSTNKEIFEEALPIAGNVDWDAWFVKVKAGTEKRKNNHNNEFQNTFDVKNY